MEHYEAARRPQRATVSGPTVRACAIVQSMTCCADDAPAWFDEALRQREEQARRHVATVELQEAS